jgi:hypothetical protein
MRVLDVGRRWHHLLDINEPFEILPQFDFLLKSFLSKAGFQVPVPTRDKNEPLYIVLLQPFVN